MANIIRRTGKGSKPRFFVRIRRTGAKVAVATFTRMSDAKMWIHETEQSIREGRYFERVEGRKHTLKEAFKRCLAEFPSDISDGHSSNAGKKQLDIKPYQTLIPHLLTRSFQNGRKSPMTAAKCEAAGH